MRSVRVWVGWSIVVLLTLVARDSAAFSGFVRDIPNGAINRCDNCHIGSPGDAVFNAFGQAWNSAGSWSPDLATADSDGDSFSNGWELQDPTGSWTPAQDSPGLSSLVTAPGDAASIPPRILVDVLLLMHEEDAGANGSSHLTVANAGGLVLDYFAAEIEDWMSLDPTSGQLASSDPADQVAVGFQTQALLPGFYEGTITVSAAGVINSPQDIAVELTVLPEPTSTSIALAALVTVAWLGRNSKRSQRLEKEDSSGPG